MNASKTFRRVIIGLSLCAIAVVFMFTSAGKSALSEARSLYEPAIAESAEKPFDAADFRNALESEIYLPQEVDFTAGSNPLVSDNASQSAGPEELTALLDGKGRQCSFQNHGALALNGQGGCI